ncbi:host-nuclease inhibitor Gam family protein [Treponema pectinovorum]|uniref:host-nuclease inhibitor Gam family protein n=1 Tax=Treponema pectinovorum TaxID=164 RepID=UPI0011CACEAC|nr:host-nuclease inhibitor Gam family protein [Treponema pectinovorum]
MARYKPTMDKLESLEDVNLALRDIGLAEKELSVIDTDANKQIAEIKTKAAKDGEKLRGRIAELSAKISAFAEYNKLELFKDKKTVDLSFGSFGFRKSTKISVKKTTVELLKRLGLHNCIRIKEEADKEVMATLDDETLLQVDSVRKTTDDFFCDVNTEEVNKDLLKGSL